MITALIKMRAKKKVIVIIRRCNKHSTNGLHKTNSDIHHGLR